MSSELIHRPWGYYQSISGGSHLGYQVKRLVVKPEAKLSLQYHHRRAEHWVVVRGTAKAQVGEDFHLLTKNGSLYIPTGVKHRLENPTKDEELEIIEVQVGDYLGEDDIVRIADVYGRV